ncbi:MAG TPA: NAD(P)H-dependent oxidoreductase [Acidobacteriaceae bacterium]|nr:NAD(P)H-dependent oxidoreductase [Acidobacteriaceae bacterium]
MTLLHVISSPRKQRSASIQVANAFIDAWKSKHPEGNIDTLNVWETDLLPFDNAALDAKYAGLEGKTRTSEQQDAWEQIKELADRFHRADLIVFSVPMWNFGVPYRLKHLIDVVSQKDVLFTFDERGLIGMLGGRTVVVIASRGAAHGDDYPIQDFDHQGAYLATWSRMVGIKDFHTITLERTLFGPEADAASRKEASTQAVALAEVV